MSVESGGGQGVLETFLRLWHVVLLPVGAAAGGFLVRWFERRDKGAAEQREAFVRRFDRLDVRDQDWFKRTEGERDRADKRAEDADARAEAAERERWRLELWLRDHEHALGNARQIADDARAATGKPPVEWKPVPRPKLPGDPP